MGTRERQRFQLGRIVATPGALEAMARRGIDAGELLTRHAAGDWGDLDEQDKRENEFSVTRRLRILSAYGTQDDPDRIWLITEADRSATTILKPDEY
jgi:hypothetical protein